MLTRGGGHAWLCPPYETYEIFVTVTRASFNPFAKGSHGAIIEVPTPIPKTIAEVRLDVSGIGGQRAIVERLLTHR